MTAETDLQTALQVLAEGLRCQGIRAVLFGGFALPIYGVERLTLDLDFLLCDEDLPEFVSILLPLGYEEVLRTPQYARLRHSSDTVLDIDTVFVDSAAMDRIWEQSVDHELGKCVLRCASLDVMLGTKLHAIRYNETFRGRRDVEDVLQLLVANGIDPGEESLRQAMLQVRYNGDSRTTMQGISPSDSDLSAPDLPIITGPTLQPRRYGAEAFCRVLSQVIEILPNRRLLVEKHRRERRPVPVRFDWQG